MPTHKKSNKKLDIKAISQKFFFDLNPSEQKALRDKYHHFGHAIILNPYARKYILKNTDDYVLFVDARRNDCYLDIKKLLEDNREKFSSFCCAGDADFIIEYSATENVHKAFLKEIYDLVKQAPKESETENLVETFKISKVFRTKGVDNNCPENKPSYQVSEDDIQKLSQIQNDYTGKVSREIFNKNSELRRFLTGLKDEQIIMGYCPLGEQKITNIKSCVLLLYGNLGYENVIIRDTKIYNKIIDFYSISRVGSGDPFYEYAKYLITAEFTDISEYNEWKEYLYKKSLDSGQTVNVMAFVYEKTISEIPMGIGDYALFDRIATSYSNNDNNNTLFLGNPYFFNTMKDKYKICMYMKTLKENGLIIGEPSTGKTFTAMIIAKKLYDRGKRVHIVDCTGGISNKFSEVYKTRANFIENVDVSNYDKSNIFGQENKIFFYMPDKDNYCHLTNYMLNHIIKMLDNDESRITNDILLFEEAHLLFNDETTIKSILECITISGRKGFSIWFSTQKLSSFPQRLLSNLKNKIIHRIDDADKKNVANILLINGGETIYNDLEHELVNLERGQAVVSFVFPVGTKDMELSPLKIKVMKE